ncbi:MAG TPA: anthranilate phosphoribosyltransferase [Candidatus Saccharimonadia bacterium]|nr:anthranilate phosphoribosyltransferase [Candidatus Saccharimonadia bacterium]
MDGTKILEQLISGRELTHADAAYLLDQAAGQALDPVQLGAILVALRMKGESADETAALVAAMRRHMLTIEAPEVLDVCGTGGDGSGTFNVSTTVAFVAAGAGVKVAKHGNRAASSRSGSADVLEALGVNVMLSPQQAREVLEAVGMVFLFAPAYHPALKQVAMVRKALGVRTVFNLLGPFANPARARRQLVGVPTPEIAERLAQVGSRLAYERLLVVASLDGLDELSITTSSVVFDVSGDKVKQYELNPAEFGFAKAVTSDLAGGDAARNAEITRAILGGEAGPRRDIVVLNAAAALVAAGKAMDVAAGLALAAEAIDSGRALSVLDHLIKETKRHAPRA